MMPACRNNLLALLSLVPACLLGGLEPMTVDDPAPVAVSPGQGRVDGAGPVAVSPGQAGIPLLRAVHVSARRSAVPVLPVPRVSPRSLGLSDATGVAVEDGRIVFPPESPQWEEWAVLMSYDEDRYYGGAWPSVLLRRQRAAALAGETDPDAMARLAGAYAGPSE